MSLHRSPLPAATRLKRLAQPRCRGGASSLLRLAQPVTPRLPAPLAVADWMSRAAGAFGRGQLATLTR
jgi:hypothetical protein